MIRFAQIVYPNYDVYKKSGFPRGYPVNKKDAAYQIVVDMIQDGYYVDFVELLIDVDSNGFMGSHYAFRGLDDVINDVIQAGYNYDETTGQFFEDQSQVISRNWGRLLEGDERQMAVMRMDIAGNSILVRENPKPLIDTAYGFLQKIILKAVHSRIGRLWSWEGDGALGVFMLGKYSRSAIFAGIEILNEMHIYNKTKNPLNSNINLRLSVHSGDLVYSDDEKKCLKADIVQKAIKLESKVAVPNSLVISESLAMAQDQSLLNIFSNVKTVDSVKYRIYRVSQDKI
jgi:class 3 adenylate cyclase